jgi:hypothetical protein
MASGNLERRILGMRHVTVEPANDFFFEAPGFGRVLRIDHFLNESADLFGRQLAAFEILARKLANFLLLDLGQLFDLFNNFRCAHALEFSNFSGQRQIN